MVEFIRLVFAAYLGCMVLVMLWEMRPQPKKMGDLLGAEEAQCLPCGMIYDVVVPADLEPDAELTCPGCGEKTLELIP